MMFRPLAILPPARAMALVLLLLLAVPASEAQRRRRSRVDYLSYVQGCADTILSAGLDIHVDDEFHALVDKGRGRKIVRQVFKAEEVSPPYEVSLVFTDSEKVRQLNRHYRGVDQPQAV